MKKINILTGALYFILAIQSSLFSADRKPQRLPNRAPSAYCKEQSSPSYTRAVGRGGCCRVFISCCLKPKLVDTFVEDAIILHTILNYLIQYTPNHIRELYLLCQNSLYVLSDLAAKQLDELGLLDNTGNIKKGWGDMILNMLKSPSNKDTHSSVSYFEQAVIDLKNQFPEIIAALHTQLDANELHIDEEILKTLHSRYKLIHSQSTITLDEIGKILTTLDNEEATYRHPTSRATEMKELTLASLDEFLLSASTESVNERGVIKH